MIRRVFDGGAGRTRGGMLERSSDRPDEALERRLPEGESDGDDCVVMMPMWLKGGG